MEVTVGCKLPPIVPILQLWKKFRMQVRTILMVIGDDSYACLLKTDSRIFNTERGDSKDLFSNIY